MKKLIFITVLFASIACSEIALAQYTNKFDAERDKENAAHEPDGFRGLKWNTEFSTVKNSMKFVGTEDTRGYGLTRIL